jgi:glycosyltransferase involved in cell wall biosynthesis
MNEVSVVIPTYNRLELLKQCIHSVRNQRTPPREIVVVDDGSTDETIAWCESQSDLVLVRCLRGGPSKARNLGVFRSTSEWVAFLDSDDLWLPEHLETLLAIRDKYPSSEWILANSILTDALLNPSEGPQGFSGAFPVFDRSLERFNELFPSRTGQKIWHGDARKQALMGNWLQPSGLLIRKEDLLKRGGFNEALWRCEDMDLLLRLVKSSPATLSLRPTYLWRLGQNDSLASNQNALLLKRGAVKVLGRSGFEVVKLHPELFAHWLKSIARHIVDYLFAKILRKTRDLENLPTLQALMQTSVAFLNLLTPVFLARLQSKEQFSDYRTFGLYLSSACSLSLTSGFWSLLPFWKSKGMDGEKRSTVAFNLTHAFAFIFAIIVFLISPIGSKNGSFIENVFLSLAIIFIIPAMFLEQNLSFNNRAFLTSTIISSLEVMKVLSIFAVAVLSKNPYLIFVIISLFLFLRLCLLLFGNLRLGLVQFKPLNLNNGAIVLRDALPICFAAAVFTFSATFDRFYLSHALTGEQFAIVAAGLLPLPLVGYLEQSVYQRTLAGLANALQQEHFEEAGQILAQAVRRISSIVIPLTAALVAFSQDIIELLFGEKYHESAIFMMIYSTLNLSACIPADLCARAQGKSSRILLFGVISCVLLSLLVILGFKNFSTQGAILASVLGTLLLRFGMLLIELKRLKINVRSFFKSSFDFSLHALIITGIIFASFCF